VSTQSPRSLTIAWATLITALGVIATHGGIAVAGGARALFDGAGYERAVAEITRDPLSLALAPAFGLGLACWVGVVRYFPDQPVSRAMGMRPISSARAALAFLTGCSLQFPLSELGNLLHERWPVPIEQQLELQRLLEPQGFYAGITAILAIVLVPSVFEELLFRGVILSGLRKRYGDGWAIAISAALFGVVHFEVAAVVYATLAGLVLGWIRVRTGSLFTTIAIHAAVNAVPLLLPSSALPIRGFNMVTEEVYHLSPWLFLITLALSTAGVWLLGRRPEEV